MGDIQVDRAAVVVMWNGKYNMDECCSRDLNWYDCADVKTFTQPAGSPMKIDKDGFILPGADLPAYKYEGRKVTSVQCGDSEWVSGSSFDDTSAQQDCIVTFQGLTEIK